MSVHQAGRVAGDKPARVTPEVTIAPMTATPSVWPTCREVVAIAAATPAWARGIPDTAALVTGALTKPRPRPNTAYAAISHPSGVDGPMPVSMAAPVSMHTPAIASGILGPWRPTIRPEIGEAVTVISASGTVASPAWTGESPRACWR